MSDFTQNWSPYLRTLLQKLFPSPPKHPMQCAEIGCFEGRGTIEIARILCSAPGSQLYCIDPWDDQYYDINLPSTIGAFRGQFGRFIKNTAEFSDKLTVLRGFSHDKIPYIPSGSLDFAFVDGDHTEVGAYQDAVDILSRMKSGAIVVFDDYGWNPEAGFPVKRAVDRFLAEYASRITVLEKAYYLCIRVN